MDSPDIKKLQKLATACRKAGISQFKFLKDGSYEFTLDPSSIPTPTKRGSRKAKVGADLQPAAPFESDSLPEDALLFWSSDSTQTSEETPQ